MLNRRVLSPDRSQPPSGFGPLWQRVQCLIEHRLHDGHEIDQSVVRPGWRNGPGRRPAGGQRRERRHGWRRVARLVTPDAAAHFAGHDLDRRRLTLEFSALRIQHLQVHLPQGRQFEMRGAVRLDRHAAPAALRIIGAVAHHRRLVIGAPGQFVRLGHLLHDLQVLGLTALNARQTVIDVGDQCRTPLSLAVVTVRRSAGAPAMPRRPIAAAAATDCNDPISGSE